MADEAIQLLQLACAAADDPRPMPSAIVVVAHPDDEAVSIGSRLPRLREAIFVHVTDGSPRNGEDARLHGFATPDEYARARGIELQAAFTLAGIALERLRPLNCPDQEAALNLRSLSLRLAQLLQDEHPQVVFTHPYEGGHPDHDATAFAVHAAAGLLRQRGQPSPLLIEMTSYHNGPNGIEVDTFLPAEGGQVITVKLNEQERRFKSQLLACFATQQETLKYFPVGIERYRIAPAYDFARPPHAGLLYYELFPWGMTGQRFVQLARDALSALGLKGSL